MPRLTRADWQAEAVAPHGFPGAFGFPNVDGAAPAGADYNDIGRATRAVTRAAVSQALRPLMDVLTGTAGGRKCASAQIIHVCEPLLVVGSAATCDEQCPPALTPDTVQPAQQIAA